MVLLVRNPFRSGPHIGTGKPNNVFVDILDILQVANETRNRYMGVGYDYRDLNETAKIFRRTLLVGPADDIADFRRIMFDAGAGVSKHKLWLAARAAGQNGNMTGGLCRNAPATGSAIGPPTTGLDNDATGVVVPGDYTDTTCLQVV